MRALLNRLAGLSHHLRGAWDEFWFSATDVAPLAAIRVCTGLVLLSIYGAIAADVQSYLGPHAWVDSATIEQLRHPAESRDPRRRCL